MLSVDVAIALVTHLSSHPAVDMSQENRLPLAIDLAEFLLGRPAVDADAYTVERVMELIDYTFLDEAGLQVLTTVRDLVLVPQEVG